MQRHTLIVAGVSAGLAVLGMQVSGMAGEMEPPQGPAQASGMPSLGEIGRRLDDIEAAIALRDRPWETATRGGEQEPWLGDYGEIWTPVVTGSSGTLGGILVSATDLRYVVRDGTGRVLFEYSQNAFNTAFIPLNIHYEDGIEIRGFTRSHPAATVFYRPDIEPQP